MKKQRFIRFSYEVSLKRKNENNICFKRMGYIRCYIDQNEDIEKLTLTWKRYWFDNSEIVFGSDLGIDIDREDIKFNFFYSNNVCMINIGLAHYLENDYLLINDEEYIPIISITEEGSNDLENLFGKSTFSGSPRIQIPCWTRRSCMITSSIAYEAHDNYLGFSRDYAYDPIKYYRITSDHKRFWIDLWESRDNSIPVVLPKGDQIFIEAIVLFDANSIL